MSTGLQRLSAVVLFVGLVIVPVAGFCAYGWYETTALSAEILEQRRLLGRFRAVRPEMQKLPDVKMTVANFGFMDADTEAVASAKLQSRVKSIITASSAQFVSARSLAGKVDGKFRFVRLQVRLAGQVQHIQRAIHALESSRPSAVIDQVNFTSRPRQNQQRPPLVDVTLNVYSVLKPAL